MELGLERATRRGRAFLAAAALAALGACNDAGRSSAARTTEITLYAAASLRDVLTELAPDLERELGVELVLNLGSSGDLARQIGAAGKADVFFCADERDMDRLEALNLLEPGTRRDMLGNSLVVIEPQGVASR
jgi:molybdate transport system substrate-binding protein